jgi:predicted transcriptional regulator
LVLDMSISTRKARELLSVLGQEFTVSDVVSKAKLSQSTARKYVNELMKKGFIVEKDGKYTVTDKGLFLLEGVSVFGKRVEENYSYIFTSENGSPIPLKIDSIEKLYVAVKYGLVPENIFRLHVERGYLTSWLSSQLGATQLARRLLKVKSLSEAVEALEEYIGL